MVQKIWNGRFPSYFHKSLPGRLCHNAMIALKMSGVSRRYSVEVPGTQRDLAWGHSMDTRRVIIRIRTAGTNGLAIRRAPIFSPVALHSAEGEARVGLAGRDPRPSQPSHAWISDLYYRWKPALSPAACRVALQGSIGGTGSSDHDSTELAEKPRTLARGGDGTIYR